MARVRGGQAGGASGQRLVATWERKRAMRSKFAAFLDHRDREYNGRIHVNKTSPTSAIAAQTLGASHPLLETRVEEGVCLKGIHREYRRSCPRHPGHLSFVVSHGDRLPHTPSWRLLAGGGVRETPLEEGYVPRAPLRVLSRGWSSAERRGVV